MLTAHLTLPDALPDLNDPPTISDLPDKTVAEDSGPTVFTFAVGDLETPTDQLTVAVNSSDATLLPSANMVLGGTGNNRTLSVTPAANQACSATIAVTV